MYSMWYESRNDRDSNKMEADKEHITHLLYKLCQRNNAAEKGDNRTSINHQRYFERCCSGERTLQLQDQPRLSRPRKFDGQLFLKVVEEDKRVTTAEKYKVDKTTVVRRMRVLGFVRKLNVWVSHELSQKSKE